MLSVTRADGSAERQTLELLRSRSGEVDRKVATVVTQIIETVRQEGDAALRRYAEQFDSAVPARLEVTKEEIEQSLDTADAILCRHCAGQRRTSPLFTPVKNSRVFGCAAKRRYLRTTGSGPSQSRPLCARAARPLIPLRC